MIQLMERIKYTTAEQFFSLEPVEPFDSNTARFNQVKMVFIYEDEPMGWLDADGRSWTLCEHEGKYKRLGGRRYG